MAPAEVSHPPIDKAAPNQAPVPGDRVTPREPAPGREIPAQTRPLRLVLPALASGLLLWACYFPLAWSWLAWVALVPLLLLVRADSPSRGIYLAAWAAGLAFFVPALQWMRVADYRMYFTWAGLAVYCSLYFPAAAWLLRRLDRHTALPLVFTVPAVWTALEYVRGTFGTGFPWYFLGHTQHRLLPLIQVADLAGVYGVTFLAAAVNAALFDLLAGSAWARAFWNLRPRPGDGAGFRLLQATAVALALGVSLAYGIRRLDHAAFERGPTLALLQGNLDQRIRNAAADGDEEGRCALREMGDHFGGLCDRAARDRPDLVVWSETSFPGEWAGDVEGRPEADVQAWADEIAWRWPATVLLGLNSTIQGDGRELRYNSALLVRPERDAGRRVGRFVARYDKIHRIPFGEYVPFREWLPWMDRLAPYDFDYSIRVGERLTRFPLGPWRFGVLICFEDSDPPLARQYARATADGPPADFLVNISNDGWFDGSSEHEEHLAVCRFRAVECRRAVARAVNMGISAVIDGDGRVVALPGPDWAGSKKVAAVLTAPVPLDRRTSLYAAWGDWLPAGCGVSLLAGLAWGLRPGGVKLPGRHRGRV